MKGAQLRCECGAPALDVAPDYEISRRTAVAWLCTSGHANITGWRPASKQIEQRRYPKKDIAP